MTNIGGCWTNTPGSVYKGTTSQQTDTATDYTTLVESSYGSRVTGSSVSYVISSWCPTEADTYSDVPRFEAGWSCILYYDDTLTSERWDHISSAVILKGATTSLVVAASTAISALLLF